MSTQPVSTTGIDLSSVPNKDLRAVLKDLREEGEIIGIEWRGSGHLGVTLKSGKTVVVSKSPSDWRSLEQVKSQFRRAGAEVPRKNGRAKERYNTGVPLNRPKVTAPAGWPTDLREARIKAGMTQSYLGGLLHMSGAAIGLYETGRNGPSPATLRQLNDLLGITSVPEGWVQREREDQQKPGPKPQEEAVTDVAQEADREEVEVVLSDSDLAAHEEMERIWANEAATEAAQEPGAQDTLAAIKETVIKGVEAAFQAGYEAAEEAAKGWVRADLDNLRRDNERLRNEVIAVRKALRDLVRMVGEEDA